MSSYRTAPTSTTASSTSLPSRTRVWLPDPRRRDEPAEGWTASHTPRDALRRTRSRLGIREPHPVLPVVIACGALGGHIREIAARHGWQIELHCLPALLHNRPGQITIHAERIARRGIARRRRVALAYAGSPTAPARTRVPPRRTCGRFWRPGARSTSSPTSWAAAARVSSSRWSV